MEYKEKHWAIIFWHNPLGWTVSTVCSSYDEGKRELERQMAILPDFDYRLVPCEVSFKTIKAHK